MRMRSHVYRFNCQRRPTLVPRLSVALKTARSVGPGGLIRSQLSATLQLWFVGIAPVQMTPVGVAALVPTLNVVRAAAVPMVTPAVPFCQMTSGLK